MSAITHERIISVVEAGLEALASLDALRAAIATQGRGVLTGTVAPREALELIGSLADIADRPEARMALTVERDALKVRQGKARRERQRKARRRAEARGHDVPEQGHVGTAGGVVDAGRVDGPMVVAGP